MEKVSYELSKELAKQVPTTLIAWGGSQKWLPFFAFRAFFQSLFVVPTKRITNIHLADGALIFIGLPLKLLTGCKLSVTIHGLDITYRNPFYQWIVPRWLHHCDRIICISQSTLSECTKRGIPAEKCTVIGWGVNPDEFKMDATRKDLEQLINRSLKGKKVLITVGRLVPRKGVHWFVSEVMPKLGPEYIYLVIGEGSERRRIEAAISHNNLQDRVLMLGRISDHDRKVIYNTADVFVMPNIPVKGDIEGFGVVTTEAASIGLPIVASKLEGIIEDGSSLVTFVKPANVEEMQEALLKPLGKSKIPKLPTWKDVNASYLRQLSS